MATETLASDHASASATDEQIVNKEKSQAIADMIASLANEDEVKHDKPNDADGGHTTPSSKTEGDETNDELGAVEVQKSDYSPAIGDSAEDNPKHDNIEDALTLAAPLSEIEEDDTKAEPALVVVEKTDGPVSLEAHIGDKLKVEKEVIPDSNATDDAAKSQPEEPPSTEPTAEETSQQLEIEPIETEEEKQPKTVDILEVSEAELVKEAEILERSDQKDEKPKTDPEPVAVATKVQEKTQEPERELEADVLKEAKFLETSDQKQEKPEPEPVVVATEVQEKTQEPEKEPEAEVVKEAQILETSAQKEEKPEPVAMAVASGVQEKTEEPEKESQEKPQEAEQPSTVTIIPEPSTDADAVEEKTRELSAETLKETNDYEAGPTETPKAEPVVTEVEENPREPKNQSLEQKEEEQPNIVDITEVHSVETSEAIEEKINEPEVLKETNDYEAEPKEAEKAEPEVTKVDENSSEQKKESFKQEEEELPKTVIPETASTSDTVEVHPPKESDIEVVKEIDNSQSEAVPGEAEKPNAVSVVQQPMLSDIEAVKETDTSELEVLPEKEDKPKPVPYKVEEKPRELVVEAVENVGETTKEVETKQEIVLETTNNEEEKTDTIKGLISLEKTVNGEETSIIANTAQVSVNEEAQAAHKNLVEPSTEVAEKVVEEDNKKTSTLSDVIEGVSKDEAGVLKFPKQAFIDQEAKADLIEETCVEEKVVVAENDDKKEPEAVQVSSREAEVEINKDEKQIEAKTTTTEDDGPAVENEKGGDIDTKVDGISSAVREPVRETLASKFEEETTKTEVDNLEKEQTEEPMKTEVQVPEEPTKESDATKTSSKDLPKETPAKSAQKQSNNIISKVKQSLVKARKAIIGKSPSSKNHSTEAKDDIQVK